jgi:hypothetical protein
MQAQVVRVGHEMVNLWFAFKKRESDLVFQAAFWV